MKITICGSIKFMDQMQELCRQLEALGHEVSMPVKAQGVDYWSDDNRSRVEAKKKFELINEHLDKIEKSDAILVVNITKGEVEHYIGANTFLEMGFAYYRKKKIYLLNPLPLQQYIRDEIETIEPIVLNGNFSLLS